MDSRELWLARTMLELADASDADNGDCGYMRLLTRRVAELLVPAEVGLLITDATGRLDAVGASAERAARLAALQVQHQEGPGADSHRTGKPLVNASVVTMRTRWPRFASAARGSGIGVVSAFPMRWQGQAIGVICVAAEDRRLQAGEAELAEALARTAGMAIAQRRELRRSASVAEQLQRALDSRVTIEQAKGAVAARLGITPEVAFALLRGYARQTSRKLVDVAAQTISGELPAHDLVTARDVGRVRSAARQSAGQSS